MGKFVAFGSSFRIGFKASARPHMRIHAAATWAFAICRPIIEQRSRYLQIAQTGNLNHPVAVHAAVGVPFCLSAKPTITLYTDGTPFRHNAGLSVYGFWLTCVYGLFIQINRAMRRSEGDV